MGLIIDWQELRWGMKEWTKAVALVLALGLQVVALAAALAWALGGR